MNELLTSMGLRGVLERVRVPQGNPPATSRPGWELWVVSVKRVGDPWPISDGNRIYLAQKNREAGTHTTVQHTTPEGWNFLYCLPLTKPQERAA